MRIFEACNFQDLTGQRIAKVLATLKFIEERVAHMVEIWGGMDALKTYTDGTNDSNRDPLLHGPKLDGDHDHVSQDDVDALFASD
jgi:chemotaxis protein CheZ